jgi:hypothetical protein
MNYISPAEAHLLAQALRPRLQALLDLHAAQVQTLPAGDTAWADTEEAIELCSGAMQKLEAIA